MLLVKQIVLDRSGQGKVVDFVQSIFAQLLPDCPSTDVHEGQGFS